MHDILVLLSFLYLWQTLQKILIILTYLDSIENILLLFCHFFSYLPEENKSVYSNKTFTF